MNETAPAAKAPKTDTVFLESFPKESAGPNILTVVGYNFIKDHTFEKDTGETYQADAVEFYFGTTINDKPFFVKSWPKTYSISPKAFFFKLYSAALGKPPAPGCNPKDVLGAGVTLTLDIKDKVSGKGKAYVNTAIKGDPSPVHAKLKGEIVPLAVLRPALELALAPKKEESGNPY